MSATPNLGLPYIEAGQAQKHVTHNEALRALDMLVQLAVQDRDLAAPPDSPEEGQRWIVASGASGAWEDHVHHIAAWQDGAWVFTVPLAGWLAYVLDETALVAWDGAAWHAVTAGGGGGGDLTELQNLSLLGVGAVADETNPVSATLNNVLWIARTVAEGGDGTLRYKLSKESEDKVLSFLFQDDFVGAAEIGLVGDDDFQFKVSPDGTNWIEAIRIARANGVVSFPAGGVREVLAASRTYYVRSDGSDGNDGLTNDAGGAFATIQKAWNALVKLDLNGFSVTIQLGNSATFTSGLSASVAPVGGNVILQGDATTPSNTIISTTGADAIALSCVANLRVQNLEVRTATAGYGVAARVKGANITIGAGMRFGACASGHILAQPGQINITNPSGYTIAGNTQSHFQATAGGLILVNTLALTLSGTPEFSWAFAVAATTGLVDAYSLSTASGSATGARYSIQTGGVINTYSGGANYFPGNAAGGGGTTTGGGVYA